MRRARAAAALPVCVVVAMTLCGTGAWLDQEHDRMDATYRGYVVKEKDHGVRLAEESLRLVDSARSILAPDREVGRIANGWDKYGRIAVPPPAPTSSYGVGPEGGLR